MPIFYNSGVPTPTTKNTINSVTLGTITGLNIRDFLLNKNLAPVYPQLSTSLNGSPRIGEPVLDTMVGTGNITQPYGLPLESEGILRMEIAILPNKFKNTSSTSNNLIIIDDIPQSAGVFPNSTWQNGITSYPTGSNPDVFEFGIMGKTIDAGYRKNATIKNLYLDVDKQVDSADWITLETAPITQQIKGYLDVYGGLNLGGGAGIQAANIIGSVLNGQGLGLAKGGVVTNFDIRSSLSGRILGATGIINDTKLGMIGGQQLALALANNAAFNVEQAALGAFNVQDNILSLVKNGTLAGFRPNYQITVPSSNGGRVLDYTARILGFTLPKSYLGDAGSIFLSESNSANIERANSMILNTGRGQVQALINNIFSNLNGTGQYDNPDTTPFRSGYAPGFKDNTGKEAINANLYAFYNSDKSTIYNFLVNNRGVIPEINYNRSGMINAYGFTGPEENIDTINPYADSTIRKPTFTWGSDIGNGTNNIEGANQFASEFKKKSLLAKTQMLFNDVGMKNIVSAKGLMNITPSQLQTAVVGYGISKGNAVMSSGNFDLNTGRYIGTTAKTADETYCRSWTSLSRYEKVQNLVRSNGLSSVVPYRNQINNSVLDEYGFAKIGPYATDKPDDPKKYMFSIENLAWADDVQNLLPCEVGSGDLMTGKQGRIMWFPPYDIKFSESNSVSWEANDFIGRGESVYTYNNTKRGGQLSFSIIVDHPSYVNSFRGSDGPDDHYIASFFAGCVDPNSKFAEKLTVSEISSIESQNITIPQKAVDPTQEPPIKEELDIFFPNDVSTYVAAYENGLCGTIPIDYTTYVSGCGINSMQGEVTSNTSWADRYNYGLNAGSQYGKSYSVDNISFSGFSDPNLIPAINNWLNEKCPKCVVQVTGYASQQGNVTDNNTLAKSRATKMVANLKPLLHTNITNQVDKDARFKIMPSKPISSDGCNPTPGSPTDILPCKIARKVGIKFVYNPNLGPKTTANAQPITPPASQLTQVNTKITNRFYTECNYFEQLTDSDYFIFDKFREKIKYFHPAFHSTTPEGLNSRLTFLNQCTRQGRTLEGMGANNLAFGRPPVCILRIGDFYNTKIIIENISIDYEPLVWDLNPEGVGVQPMIAKVNMSFNFIGGSTLMGPINKLQNALSFNYYANTQVYDPRADYIAKSVDLSASLAGKDMGLKNTLSIDGKYAIVDGIIDANKDLSTVSTTTAIQDNTGIQYQLIANDNEGGPNGPQTSAPINDLDKIKIISIVFNSNKNSSKHSLTGTLTLNLGISSPLTKSYDFKLKLFDINNDPIDIGVGTLTTTDTTKAFIYNINSTSFSTNIVMSSYQIELSFGSTKKIYNKINI